jgi:putative transcriptional regulator
MNSLKGHLLIAAPTMLSDFFARTVILMLDHDEDGALGVVLNRPTEATVADVAEHVLGGPFDWDKPIRLGGPVAGPLMAIHDVEALADREVIPGVYSSVEADKVRELIRRRHEPCLIVANYAGWGPGQLEGEFDVDSWVTLPAAVDHVFGAEAAGLWAAVVRAANARKLSEFLGLRGVPSDPSLN